MPLFTRKKAEAAEEYRPLAELPPPWKHRPDHRAALLEAHRKYLLSCVSELPPFRQHLLDALDLSLCEEIVADLDLPRFDNSAMDGYAVRAADVAGACRTGRSACRWWGRSPPGRRRCTGCRRVRR